MERNIYIRLIEQFVTETDPVTTKNLAYEINAKSDTFEYSIDNAILDPNEYIKNNLIDIADEQDLIRIISNLFVLPKKHNSKLIEIKEGLIQGPSLAS